MIKVQLTHGHKQLFSVKIICHPTVSKIPFDFIMYETEVIIKIPQIEIQRHYLLTDLIGLFHIKVTKLCITIT